MTTLKALPQPLVRRTNEQLAILREYAVEQGLPVNIYEDFSVFAHYMVPLIGEEQYEWEWFHYYICDMYNDVIFKGTKLFSIELPPQIGKSLLTSLFIVYCFGINPDLSIMYVTYNEDKAKDFTKKYVIHQLGTDKFSKIFPFVYTKNMLDKKDNTKKGSFQKKTAIFSDTSFTLSCPITTMQKNYRGGYKCFGMEQGIHGSPANIFLVDDYVDKGESVRSENFRRQRKEWFLNDMASRLQGNNSVVGAICTRWYYEDIIGLMTNAYYKNIIPLFEQYNKSVPDLKQVRVRTNYRTTDNNPPCDPRTKDDQILWEEHLLKLGFACDGEHYQAVYNCDPSSTDSAKQLKESDFGYYSTLPSTLGRYIFVIDGASSTNKKADSTAIGYWFVTGNKRYLVKLWYVKKEVPELIDFVNGLLSNNKYDQCLIEYASSGIPLSQFLEKSHNNIIKLSFNGRAIESNAPSKKSQRISKGNSKAERFYRILSEFSYAGEYRVFLPINQIEHQIEFLRQILTFDGTPGRKDDFVDVLSYLVYYTMINTIQATVRTKINQKNLHNNNNLCYNGQNDVLSYR